MLENYNPVTSGYFDSISSIVDDLFRIYNISTTNPLSYSQSNPSFPPMNFVEDKNSKFIEMKIAIAGFSKEDITIETEDEYLIVKGEKKELFDNYEKDSVYWIKNNLRISKFSRAFEFDSSYYDYKNPKVNLKDGILTIRIEKNPEFVSPKKLISIE